MRVYLGADHAGFERKNQIIEHLTANGHEAIDCGAFEYDAQDDYPPFCFEVGERTVTVRDRDSMEQARVGVDRLEEWLVERIEGRVLR